jgi:NAD(P)-dependent dehydrogenase (short-subunit alcohol dehydrogenase family)
MKISQGVFVITGASSGLGRATAQRFVSQGASVVLCDVNEDAGTALERDLGKSATFVRVDVRETADVQRAVTAARSKFGGLHGAVNCAGIVAGSRTVGRSGPHDLELFRRVIEINLIGTFNVVRLVAASLADNDPGDSGERGVIVNTASVAAFDGQVGQAAYSASKGGVAGMTLPIARDLSKIGVRVVSIAPGIFETPMMAGMTDEVRGSLEQQVPFPSRLGNPDEFAFLAQHIVENGYLNGETIRLDGAIRMAPR